jgi:hypothetical protein
MFRRRIEVTRERWTRVSFGGPCPICGRPADLVPAADTPLSAEVLDAAIASGRLHAWQAGQVRLVCRRCLDALQKELEK